MRAALLGLGWLGTYYLLAQYAVFALPKSVARDMTLPQYLAAVQILSILVGVTTVLFATKGRPELRRTFFPEIAGVSSATLSHAVLWSLLLAPLAYFISAKLGVHFALEALVAELRAQGAQAVQQQTGELGRSARVDTLWTIIPFTVILAPLGEELLFRGGVYGAVQSFFSRKGREVQADVAPPSAPESIAIAGLPGKKSAPVGARLFAWGASGGFAVLVSSVIFGAMHADTPGGMGIIRLVGACCLGLACGVARHLSGGLAAPLALHAAYNLFALATMRGWLVFEGWPTKNLVPTALLPLALGSASLASIHYIVVRRGSAQARSD